MAILWSKEIIEKREAIKREILEREEKERAARRLADAHFQMCLSAEVFLKRLKCGFVFRDGFKAITPTGEQPDAIGFRGNVSILIEVKVTRADYLADAKKKFRAIPELGVGDWRFYMCPTGLIKPEELPAGWGLIYCDGGKFNKVAGFPSGNVWTPAPFVSNPSTERAIMYSALRRMEIRGHLPQVYESIPAP